MFVGFLWKCRGPSFCTVLVVRWLYFSFAVSVILGLKMYAACVYQPQCSIRQHEIKISEKANGSAVELLVLYCAGCFSILVGYISDGTYYSTWTYVYDGILLISWQTALDVQVVYRVPTFGRQFCCPSRELEGHKPRRRSTCRYRDTFHVSFFLFCSIADRPPLTSVVASPHPLGLRLTAHSGRYRPTLSPDTPR